MIRLVTLLPAILLIAACGSSSPATSEAATPTATPKALATTTSPPADAITGFGATDASWNAHHTADTEFAPGAAYNPDPNLPQVNGHTGAHYVATNHTDGRVLGYTMNLMPDTGITEAKASVISEFPSDASIVWFGVKDSCAQMEVKSAILGFALKDPAIGDAGGLAFVELDTVRSDGSSTYDANNINEALLMLGRYMSAADAPTC